MPRTTPSSGIVTPGILFLWRAVIAGVTAHELPEVNGKGRSRRENRECIVAGRKKTTPVLLRKNPPSDGCEPPVSQEKDVSQSGSCVDLGMGD